MKYTYKYDIQGGGESHYLCFFFDRQIVPTPFYRHRTGVAAAQRELCDAIAHTPGVLRNDRDAWTGRMGNGELILMEGASLTVAIALPKNVPELAKQIVKKVQRRLAPKEGRQRITKKALDAYVKKLNATTYGV